MIASFVCQQPTGKQISPRCQVAQELFLSIYDRSHFHFAGRQKDELCHIWTTDRITGALFSWYAQFATGDPDSASLW
jgi:hypothetical protein